MENILEEYLDWHKEQFPDTQLDQVLVKCCEEVTEFVYEYDHGDSVEKYMLELADVIFIHAAYIHKLTNGNTSLSDILRRKLAINRLNYIDGVRVNKS